MIEVWCEVFDVNILIWNVYYVFLGCGGCICYEICDIKKEILIEIFKRLYVFLILLLFEKNFYWIVFKCYLKIGVIYCFVICIKVLNCLYMYNVVYYIIYLFLFYDDIRKNW